METRSERNKKLYNELNKKISEIEYRESNGEFKNTNDVLSAVNPSLFGNKKEEKDVSKKANKTNPYILAGLISLAVIIVVIVIVVVVNK